MRNYSRLNNHTTLKMIGYGRLTLLVHPKLWNTANMHNLLWYGLVYAQRTRHHWFSLIRALNLIKKFINTIFGRIRPYHGHRGTSETENGCYFITSEEWPPYSPDLNPIDFSIWSILQASACSKPDKSLESLNQSLQAESQKIPQNHLRRISQNFKERLQLCIKAKGGHFETD